MKREAIWIGTRRFRPVKRSDSAWQRGPFMLWLMVDGRWQAITFIGEERIAGERRRTPRAALRQLEVVLSRNFAAAMRRARAFIRRSRDLQ